MRKRAGQTLVIALIVLFVLLLIGFVFLGILNRNIVQTAQSRQHTLAEELADAGIRYAREQLVNSPLGADWRPSATTPVAIVDKDGNQLPSSSQPNTTPWYSRDPDLYWIRPASLKPGTYTSPSTYLLHAGDLEQDMGGPDGLGPFTRINFKTGRALIRVRYAPSDVDVTIAQGSSSNTAGYYNYGPLRQPGKLHNYIIIESVGRPGVLNPSDPTTIPSVGFVPANLPLLSDGPSVVTSDKAYGSVAFQYFNSQTDLRTAVSQSSSFDSQIANSRKLLAFASIGIIDDALFVANREHTTKPAEIGIPSELGVTTTDDAGATQISVQPALVLGGSTFKVPGSTTWTGGGSVYVNGDALLYGSLQVSLNSLLGESFNVSGRIVAQNAIAGAGSASVTINEFQGATSSGAVTVPNVSSAGYFDTLGGFYRDYFPGVDIHGLPRSVAYKPSPDILSVDPNTGYNRYISLTRDSGQIFSTGNSGQYGHGKGVYVGNSADVQSAHDENGRIAAGASDALFYDWLNPNNGLPNSSWQGPFYVPPGAFVQLEPNGFTITLNASGPADQRTWRTASGADSGLTSLKFRLIPNPAYGDITTMPPGNWNIVDSLTPGVNIDNTGSSDYSKGLPFNGVLFFEGNVRVRGVIPDYNPLTLVSMGTIYVEGSITKGVVTDHAPRTSLALLARDYVALNTTQFFGPATSTVTEKNSAENPIGVNPVVMTAANGEINLITEFLRDPDRAQNSQTPSLQHPQNWPEYAGEYSDPQNPSQSILTRLLLTHAMDDGPAPYAYTSLNINDGYTIAFPQANPDNSGPYSFLSTDNTSSSAVYTLGQDSWQRYSKFETRGFPFLVPQDTTQLTDAVPAPPNTSGLTSGFPPSYDIKDQESGTAAQYPVWLWMHSPPVSSTGPANDYLLARAAIIPHDIRIEAVIYAQQGSFFVIPGEWFNPNPNDRRGASYQALGTTDAERQLARTENFGNDPYTPFYQEPLDVKVTIVGSINEDMPAPMSQQTEWLKKWGWIPREHGASGELIPSVHVPSGYDVTSANSANPSTYLYVPNLYIKYDPILGTGRVDGYDPSDLNSNPPVRVDPNDPAGLAMLPPMPCLPVCPTLFYFGEVNP